MEDVPRTVLSAWPLAPIEWIERADQGVMNDIWIVTTTERRVVLRGHRRDRAGVEREHWVMDHARAAGVPVPAVIPAADGSPIVERAGRLYSLVQHAAGAQVSRDELTPPLAEAMGTTLVEIHDALGDIPLPPLSPPYRPSADETRTRIEGILDRIEAWPDPGEQEQWAIEQLRSRAAFMAAGGPPGPPAITGEALQWFHGDYQESNLFFADGRVSAVIDWDKAMPGWPAGEMVRTIAYSLSLSPELTRAFLRGYRARRSVSDHTLDTAAVLFGYWSAHDLWVYDMAYVHGDERVRRFLKPGPYVPFEEDWARLRAAL